MDKDEKKTTKRGLRHDVVVGVAALLGLLVGLGGGIGIGAGIWKSDSSTNDVCDASIEHNDNLVTYILSVGQYEILPKPSSEFVDVVVPKDSLPAVMPYVINDVKHGVFDENLLNTTMFLEDWSALCLQMNETNGEFAMPGYAAAQQCYKEYRGVIQASTTPPNAMVIRNDEEGVHRFVHVYNVTEEPERFVFTMLPVTEDNPQILPEGQCHSYQNLSSPHFHHASTCSEYDANWIIGQNGTRGSGLTAFIKLGPLIDTAVGVGVDAAIDAGADAGADAAVDAGADAASDAGADTASDVSSDSGYNGDDIVSDASSDGASDRADTMIGNDNEQGGGGGGFTAAVVGAGATVATADTLAASNSTDSNPDGPRG